MRKAFRQAMAWLHTWTGLTTGWVLYFVFVTGTLGYFYIEIDRWMRPELPLAGPMPSAEQALSLAEDHLRREAADADVWSIVLPSGRHGAELEVSWVTAANGDTRSHELIFDPERRSLVEPAARETGGGYELYRMHWHLNYLPRNVGGLIVGLCTMIAFVALITGVVTHRKFFVDFFTFRPGKGQRSWLDGHNLVGVLSLPFFLMITYSGLTFGMMAYVPAASDVIYDGGPEAVADEIYPFLDQDPPPVGLAPLLPLERFVDEATDRWGAGSSWWWLQVYNPGHANAEVRLWRSHYASETVLRDVIERLHFNGADGGLIGEVTARRSAAIATLSALHGLHEGIFAGPALRWLYFLSGVLGCVVIASGLILWTVKRRAKHERKGESGFGHSVVEHLNIGTIVGLPIGVAAYFWANRLLPVGLADRAAWETHCLFLAWGLMLAYPALRPPKRAWIEELWIAGGAFALLPALNALTTDRHLGVTLPAGDWALAGFDLTVLAFGVACISLATLRHRRTQETPAPAGERTRNRGLPRPQEVG